ncbi:hypothetical protein CARUB_v10002327mg [Capsella rubella]|uniref:Uncharacterized protein n=1 Tax=Capsella rubella TaxID=81985 RepID=R0FHM5_9BRAS|nr:hypothetical protein CARUB_v10002327mg [Capsella rubella]
MLDLGFTRKSPNIASPLSEKRKPIKRGPTEEASARYQEAEENEEEVERKAEGNLYVPHIPPFKQNSKNNDFEKRRCQKSEYASNSFKLIIRKLPLIRTSN